MDSSFDVKLSMMTRKKLKDEVRYIKIYQELSDGCSFTLLSLIAQGHIDSSHRLIQQIGDAKIYLLDGKNEVIMKTQVPIWDVPIGREPPKDDEGAVAFAMLLE